MSTQGPASAVARLERDAIGLAPVLFQSITHMAPAAAVAFSIIFAVTYAGGATPLAVVLALVACLMVAISIGQLARHLPSAGGLYTYNARALHPTVGFFVAWGFMLAEPLVAPLLYLIFGNVISVYLNSHFNTPTWLWAPFAALAGIGVWLLVYRGIRISTEAGVALGAFEIVVFLALAITLIIAAGSNNTLAVFSPSTGNSSGLGSVFAGMVYTVLAFIGFEASVWGPFSILVLLAIINSAFANSNAGANAATRVGYALARVGILPRALANVHPRFKTPYVAVHVQGALGIALALILGFALGGPLNAFALLGTIATLVIVIIYILTNLSNLVFYLREHREELNPIWNVVVPVLGIIIFIPVLLASFGINFFGLGIVGLVAPASYAPWVVLAWLVLGAVLYFYLSARSPAAIRETATTFVEA